MKEKLSCVLITLDVSVEPRIPNVQSLFSFDL